MKNVNLAQYCLSATLAMDDLSSVLQKPCVEPNLEELINSVFVGKTSIDKVSGKCVLASDEEKASTNLPSLSSTGNFNPLTLPVVQNQYCDPTTNETESSKRTRVLPLNESPTHEQSLKVNCEPVVSRNKEIQNISLINKDSTSQRLKRKRRLLDDESELLRDADNDKMDDFQNSNSNSSEVSNNKLIANETLHEKLKLQDINLTNLSQTEDITCQITATKPHLPLPTFAQHEEVEDLKSNNIDVMASRLSSFQELSLKDTEKDVTCMSEDSSPNSKLPTNAHESLHTDSVTAEISFGDSSCLVLPTVNSNENETKNDMKQSPVSAEKRKNENEPEGRTLRKRIRKTLPPLKTRHTPLGLPKPLRLKKVTFSLEEIYTNKNYSTPVPKMLETIFEYPKEDRDGHLKYAEKRRKPRAMYFSTNPANRPTKKRAKSKFKKRSTRRNNCNNDVESDAKLINVLADLDRQLELEEMSP